MLTRDRQQRRAVLFAGGSLIAGLAGCLGSDETEPPRFNVTAEAPGTATVSETVTVTWTVTNRGGRNGTQTVRFRVDDRELGVENVTLASGERTTGQFTVTPGSEGALPTAVLTDNETANATVLVERP